MSDYISKSLAPNETIVVRGKWPTIFWVGAWLALIFLGVIVVGIFMFVRSAIKMSTTRFAVTDQRVVLKQGWLNVSTSELAIESIEGVHLTQSLWGRLFGYGHVVVTGTGDATIAFPPMAHPVEFRRALLGKQPRAARVLEEAASRAGWGRAPAGRHHGLALMEGYGHRPYVVEGDDPACA